MALHRMKVQDGPRADAEVYLDASNSEWGDTTMRWFELDGTEILQPVSEWAHAYTCVDPAPPVPGWYAPAEG
jgi:hypothetical protein